MTFVVATILALVIFNTGILEAGALEDVPPFKIDFADEIFSHLDNQGKVLLSDYAKAYPKIKRFYSNIRLDVTEKHYRNAEEFYSRSKSTSSPLNDRTLDLIRETRYQVRYNDVSGGQVLSKTGIGICVPRYGRLDFQHRFQLQAITEIDNELRQRNNTHQIEVYTPAHYYDMGKVGKEKEFYSLKKRRNIDANEFPSLYFDRSPYSCANGYPLEYLLLSSELLKKERKYPFYVDYVKQVNRQGQELIEVRTYTDMGGGKDNKSNPFTVYTLLKGSLVVNSVYSCYSYQSADEKLYWNSMKCTYSGEKDGVPLLKAAEKSEGIIDGNASSKKEIITKRTVWEVTSIVPGPVPLKEFDVAQFLPPEAKDALADGAPISPFRIFCLIAGPILIAIAILIKIRNARKKK